MKSASSSGLPRSALDSGSAGSSFFTLPLRRGPGLCAFRFVLVGRCVSDFSTMALDKHSRKTE